MCGLLGGINTSRADYSFESIHHRGPDDFGHWENENIWMDHYRLSIIDLSENAKQPMESMRYVMAYNGEVFNYKELAYYVNRNDDLADYVLPGDSRVILNYFEKFGIEKTLDELNGMFAIALYDKWYKKLHLIVDRFSQKPLYYWHEGDKFAFASSPGALLHLKPKWKISEQALQSYWKLGSVMEDSIWDGIKKVDGSEIITYDLEKKTITKERYWEPKFQEKTDGIEDLVIDAIRKVKVADVPVKIFLSGGIDSTLVASQFEGGEAIHLAGPEQKYAQQAAERFNINLHVVDPKETCAICAIKDYSRKCGEPSMAGLQVWITAREAAKFCKVAVTANGADELFFGYDRTQDKITDGQINHILRSSTGNAIMNFGFIDPRLSEGRWFELDTYVKRDLNKTLDFAAMAHSLEVRSPFLDHRLVEMALSIPQQKHGRKDILKNILKRYGFDDKFLNRPKQSFSLYRQPKGYEELKEKSYKWAIENKYLTLTSQPNKRDEQYLKASAAGFYGWYETFKDKID